METDDGWSVARSNIDRRVWVPVPVGFGDIAHMLNAGPLRKVKEYVEEHEPDRELCEWRKVDEDHWWFGWRE